MSRTLGEQYQRIQNQFYALSLRERVLTAIATVILILLGGTVLFVEPLLVQWESNKMEIQRQSAEVARLEIQIAALQQSLQQDPNAPIKARLANLQLQISAADQSLARQTENLVPANKMPQLLDSVFAQFETLKLLEMRSIAPTKLLALEDEKKLTDVNLYQHGVTLTLEGKYFEIQQYLQRVEALPYQFYWKKFNYQVGEYPSAKVQIEIYTLSTSRAFIGVWTDA
ncbi:MSHA biogenesis protein MshJ [Aliiglaciecola sp. LCG003]|uniref:MSHA biogenesis protein MshJ n=1 Tax=Aliiglaciecola sp. LCG003 TaxID=3053655 RepID=UPI002573DC90|nr:MSHA biogenesis protein MshJ [Aliiglaciecola sp. LCG003]WJG09701.1 MSHA biogenesis protein MshJ [Aliiglaciecola sp. LCG003]